MELLNSLWELISHPDQALAGIIRDYQAWTYLILFAIIFCETGLVVTPFLPGDSLLFAAGALAASESVAAEECLNVTWLFVLLAGAAILGDTVNYWAGHYIGPRAFSGEYRFLKREYLDRTHRFYERHGGKTIVLARFIPIIRTFAPFVAGIGEMTYSRFICYNVIGGIAWIAAFIFGGYFFGNLPMIKNNFTLVIIAIIILSVLPGVIEYFRQSRESV